MCSNQEPEVIPYVGTLVPPFTTILYNYTRFETVKAPAVEVVAPKLVAPRTIRNEKIFSTFLPIKLQFYFFPL